MFGAKEKRYRYFKQKEYIQTRIKDYDKENKLYTDWITLDAGKQEEVRVVNNLAEVLGKVGGLQHLLVLVFGYFFRPYTMYTFR